MNRDFAPQQSRPPAPRRVLEVVLERLRRLLLPVLVIAALIVSGVSRRYTARSMVERASLPTRISYQGALYERRGPPVPLPQRARVGRLDMAPIYTPMSQIGDYRVYLFFRHEGSDLFQPYERLFP